MPLHVRQGDADLLVRDKEELARLYRGRRIAPSDLVWHPGAGRWTRLDAFLFIDGRPRGERSPAVPAIRRPADRASGDPAR